MNDSVITITVRCRAGDAAHLHGLAATLAQSAQRDLNASGCRADSLVIPGVSVETKWEST